MGKTVWEIWLLFKHDGKGHFHHGIARYPDGSCKELTVSLPRPAESVISDGEYIVTWHDYHHEIEVQSWDKAVDELVFKVDEDFPYEIYPKRYARNGEDVRLERTEEYDHPTRRHYGYLSETPWIDYPEVRQQCPEGLENNTIWEIWLTPDDHGHFEKGIAFYPDGSKFELTSQNPELGRTIVTDGRHTMTWLDYLQRLITPEGDVLYPVCEVDIQSWPEEIVEIILHWSGFNSYTITGHKMVYGWGEEYIKRRSFYENYAK